jgi:hypothetical protein
MSTKIEPESQSIGQGIRIASGWQRTLRRVLVASGIAASLLYVAANVLGPICGRGTARQIKTSASSSPWMRHRGHSSFRSSSRTAYWRLPSGLVRCGRPVLIGHCG